MGEAKWASFHLPVTTLAIVLVLVMSTPGFAAWRADEGPATPCPSGSVVGPDGSATDPSESSVVPTRRPGPVAVRDSNTNRARTQQVNPSDARESGPHAVDPGKCCPIGSP